MSHQPRIRPLRMLGAALAAAVPVTVGLLGCGESAGPVGDPKPCSFVPTPALPQPGTPVGTTPTFDWQNGGQGRCLVHTVAVDSIFSFTAHAMVWEVTTLPNISLAPPVRYGVVPPGAHLSAATPTFPATLQPGHSYRLVLFSRDSNGKEWELSAPFTP